MLDQLLAFAPCRRADFHLALGLGSKRLRKQSALLEIVRNENESRRRLIVVKLREESAQNFLRPDCPVGFVKICAVAPVLAGAEEEHFDARKATGLVHGEYVGFLNVAGIYALMRLDR